MPTDRSSQRASDNPVDGSPVERARYLTMLGHWARGDVVSGDLGTVSAGDHTDRNAKK